LYVCRIVAEQTISDASTRFDGRQVSRWKLSRAGWNGDQQRGAQREQNGSDACVFHD
jgi:hypothetical protein